MLKIDEIKSVIEKIAPKYNLKKNFTAQKKMIGLLKLTRRQRFMQRREKIGLALNFVGNGTFLEMKLQIEKILSDEE